MNFLKISKSTLQKSHQTWKEGETGKGETTENSDKNDQDKVEVVKVNSAENDTVSRKGAVNTNVKYESVSTRKSPKLLSPTSALKKDFRIIRQVGQNGNKDKQEAPRSIMGRRTTSP